MRNKRKTILLGDVSTTDNTGCITPDCSSQHFSIYQGDALQVLSELKEQGVVVDCVVTSPPYYNQRVYGDSTLEIGNNHKDVAEYISSLVAVFKAVPLAPWGSIWVNIGDKRDSKGGLLNIPSQFSIAMQEAEFYLVDAVVWAKEVVSVDGTTLGHTMVEPAKGRLNGHGWEPLLRFARNPKKAWSDTCAVRIPRDVDNFFHKSTAQPIDQSSYKPKELMECTTSIVGRNATNVWRVAVPHKGKGHFASFPEALIERPVVMTCPEDVTADGPRTRIVENTVYSEATGKSNRFVGQYSLAEDQLALDESTLTDDQKASLDKKRTKAGRMDFARHYTPRYPKTVGWTHADLPVTPGIVLDPFGGTGTVGSAAIKLGRKFIGIDLYQEYVDRMNERCQEAFETYTRNVERTNRRRCRYKTRPELRK